MSAERIARKNAKAVLNSFAICSDIIWVNIAPVTRLMTLQKCESVRCAAIKKIKRAVSGNNLTEWEEQLWTIRVCEFKVHDDSRLLFQKASESRRRRESAFVDLR